MGPTCTEKGSTLQFACSPFVLPTEYVFLEPFVILCARRTASSSENSVRSLLKISPDQSKHFFCILQKSRSRGLRLRRLKPRSPRYLSLGWATSLRPCRSLISRPWSSFPFEISAEI